MATKEGGAITGEERLREHTDQLYGAIQSYEGQPASYQMTRIAVLEDQLKDITASPPRAMPTFDKLSPIASRGGRRTHWRRLARRARLRLLASRRRLGRERVCNNILVADRPSRRRRSITRTRRSRLFQAARNAARPANPAANAADRSRTPFQAIICASA